jgi:hypothetical protein
MSGSRTLDHPFTCSAKAWDCGAQALEKLRYMHRNPVMDGPVQAPEQYGCGAATAAMPTARKAW